MNPRLECPDCCGCGSTERLTGHEYSGMGGGRILSEEPTCETCNGTGVRRCEWCPEPSEVEVYGSPMCGGCAEAYEREVAA